MRVAVIGTGIAGNAAAWSLSKLYPVTVYDREIRPGGHGHTVTIDYDGTPLSIDIGFIVYNELNYPNLTALFNHLGVESFMSFAPLVTFKIVAASGSAFPLFANAFSGKIMPRLSRPGEITSAPPGQT